MSAPLLPSPLDYIGRRRFAFYPPITHPDPNEWMLGSGCRSEVQAVNAHTGREIWIPRQYIGAVSEGTHTPFVVGLTKALDFRGGTLAPRSKAVIEIPAGNERDAAKLRLGTERRSGPATVTGIRLDPPAESSRNRVWAALCVGAVVVALITASVVTGAHLW